jgi:hypothetical protein
VKKVKATNLKTWVIEDGHLNIRECISKVGILSSLVINTGNKMVGEDHDICLTNTNLGTVVRSI